jgi:TolB-like protein/Flp pilus assembly protein TadD
MIYRFEGFDLDTAAQELRRDGIAVSAEPQVFALLVLLVENRNRVVSRDDILETVWQGRIVSEAALSSRVKAARQAIGDDGEGQRLIRTVRKRGFRFVGDVEAVDAPEPAVAAPPAVPATPEPEPVAGEAPLQRMSEPSIAILPFQTIGEPGVLAQGLAHDLITRLGRTRWLFVIARGSAFRFIGSEESPVEIAARLGVRYIAHGAVQMVGKHIRVHAALTDATTGAEAWSEQFDRAREDIFAIQSEISDAIAGSVESQIEFLERGRSLLKPAENLDAWEAYHRGCWHMFRFRPKHYEEAERYFLRSIELDRTSPRPLSGLSFVHWQRAFLEIGGDRAGEIARARELAEAAVELDPRDPQGYHALGRALFISGEVEASERELQKAVDLNPSFAIGHYSLARSLYYAGLLEESQEAVSRAQRLSPYDPMRFAMISMRATTLLSLGATEEAADLIAQAVEESNAHYHILAIAANIAAAAGRMQDSANYLARLKAIRPEYGLETYLRAFPVFRAEEIRTAQRVFNR